MTVIEHSFPHARTWFATLDAPRAQTIPNVPKAGLFCSADPVPARGSGGAEAMPRQWHAKPAVPRLLNNPLVRIMYSWGPDDETGPVNIEIVDYH
jgi:hypothetical protein